MENNTKRTKSETFFGMVKNLFFLLLVLQFIPIVFSSFKGMLQDSLSPKVHVGYVTLNGDITDSAFYIKKITEFEKASDIKAIFLRINSGGGYSGSCQVIFNELRKIRDKKPIVALIENAGGSGAYYISTAAHTIIASPMSMVGSIGAFMELPNVKDFLANWKVYVNYVKSGKFKTVGSPTKELTQEEREYLQAMSDDQYQTFVKDVAQLRGLDIKKQEEWADGQAFSGNQAIKLKLIDKLGSYSDAIDELKKKLKTKEDIKLVHAKKSTGFLKQLMHGGEDDYGSEELSMSDYVAAFFSSVLAKVSFSQQPENVKLA